MNVIRRRVLHNTTDHHNKYYEANLCVLTGSPSDKAYAVVCRWGRIECFASNSAQRQVKANGVTYARALDVFEDICHQKIVKGYVQVGLDMSRPTITIEEKVKTKKVEAEPVDIKDDRLEVVAGFNWFEDYDNERVI